MVQPRRLDRPSPSWLQHRCCCFLFMSGAILLLLLVASLNFKTMQYAPHETGLRATTALFTPSPPIMNSTASHNNLPVWAREYFAWHAQQRESMTSTGTSASTTNHRYLIYTCLQ